MTTFPTRICIVTPCFNAAATIDQTISSVLNQAGPFEIDYHVQDGGSTDDTLERLELWKRRIEEGQWPLFCKAIRFTYESVPDKGMYDAIARGFSKFEFADSDWLTWINADDMLAPGACALMSLIDADPQKGEISWVAGTATIISEGSIVGQADRRMASAVIKQGLCDGKHWEFVQQEGTFFRASLWATIDAGHDFSSFRLAGDWNLWRKFAQTEELFQVGYPLGLFHEREGQLSKAQRDAYMAEISGIIADEQRAQCLVGLIGRELSQKRLSVDFASRTLRTTERDLSMHLKHRLIVRFGDVEAKRLEAEYKKGTPKVRVDVARVAGFVVDDQSPPAGITGPKSEFIAYNAEWQFPAITELYAFSKARELLPRVKGVCYLAFPWATLFDQINSKFDRGSGLADSLAKLRVAERGCDYVVTVCQHIHMLQYADYLTQSGVTDVFWSHADIGQDEIETSSGKKLRIHPFPLYPVQSIDLPAPDFSRKRPYLFSFVGAKSNQWYLTQSRNWILKKLSGHPRGFVTGKDGWHYQKIVYDLQIRQSATDNAGLVDEEASNAFRQLLQDSVFSLCPSGSGPNSIRLWESIGAGAIPVILADSYKVPGDEALWKNAAVFCRETPEDIAALPGRLEAIAADPALLASMRAHLAQLWMLYGPECFVADIQDFYLEVASRAHAKTEKGPPLHQLAENIASSASPSDHDVVSFLKLCVGRLVLDPKSFADAVRQDRVLRGAAECALMRCPDSRLAAKAAQMWVAAGLDLPEQSESQTLRVARFRRPQIHLFGRHGNRTPMYYAPYRRLFEQRVDYQDDIWKADVVVTGFDTDFRGEAAELARKASVRPEMNFLVVSEEPLWDTVWSGVLDKQMGHAGAGELKIAYSVVNHVNSNVFAFEKLPYFITTEDKFFARYSRLFQRNAALSAEEILSRWQSASIRSAFYAERRLEDRFDLYRPELGVRGLCAWRTRLAEAVSRGPVVRVGQGWNPNAVRRQSLVDWHLDKLSALDQRALIVSGVENTHHPDYITEKVFDAFAVLGVPLYYAEPRHRLHEVCPEGGFLNLYGHSEESAAAMIDGFEPDLEFARAYLATQKTLAHLFSDPETLNRERGRVVSEIMKVT